MSPGGSARAAGAAGLDFSVPISSTGPLRDFAAAGVLSFAAVHVAQTVCRLALEPDPLVQLAAALTVRALEGGSVCLDLDSVRGDVEAWLAERDESGVQLPWPAASQWREALGRSPAVGAAASPLNVTPLRLVGSLLYLERYWCDEATVREHLRRRSERRPGAVDAATLRSVARGTFAQGVQIDDDQLTAAMRSATEPTTIVAGGPGSGKTATVARMLATAQGVADRRLTVALAAPSGKAAARLESSVRDELRRIPGPHPLIDPATTVHRLLGARGELRGFSRGPTEPLPHDIVVVDEMSMMALPLMAALLDALRDDCRLVLVGDPMQLTSVEAGSVLADLASAARSGSPLASLVELTHNWRSLGAVADLATAIRRGDADAALDILAAGDPAVRFIDSQQPVALSEVDAARDAVADGLLRLADAGARGDASAALAALDRQRVLCAHRHGPYGVGWWSRQIDQLGRELGAVPPGHDQWYPGRAVLVTANADELGLRNGDAGVAITTPAGLRVAFPGPGAPRLLPPWVLDDIDAVHAMTVHKAQGSQFSTVVVVLPPVQSPLLTRELVYTAITRTVDRVVVIGSRDALATAIRTPSARASGLARDS
ncbi:MAG TPA: exodeoxyribonuclease V subunit alpha [Propionibacteriaceae bacterium]|nr:exodeoxyribonuclease V subunit alpha [Propionibacteriaceae bacterium]